MNESKIKFDVIFDNAGGITLQTKNYCHYYDSPIEAAIDVNVLIKDNNIIDWEGNEPEYKMKYNHTDISNGKYKWFDENNIDEIFEEINWNNILAFARMFYEVVKK